MKQLLPNRMSNLFFTAPFNCCTTVEIVGACIAPTAATVLLPAKNQAFPPHLFTLLYYIFPQITPPIHSARMAAAAPRAKMDMAVGKMGRRGSLGAAVPTQSRAAFFACCSSS